MKNLIRYMSSGAVFVALISMASVSAATETDGDKKVVTYSIESVFCSGCVAGIHAIVGEIDGVISIEVDVESHRLTVVYDEIVTEAGSLMERITEETTFELMLLSIKDFKRDG